MTAVSADTTPVPDSETSPNDAGLLPCPFCGSPANIREKPEGFVVECTKRHSWTGCPVNMRTHHCISVETAADLWNTRTSKAVTP